MKSRRVSIGIVLALSLGVPSAGAQSSSAVFLFGTVSGSPPVSTIQIPAGFTGTVTVSFHGDPGTGCAAQGLCGYSGTVALRPGSGGAIGVVRYRAHGHLSYQAGLSLSPGPGAVLAAAQVRRVGGGVCGDAQHPNVALNTAIQGGTVNLPLFRAGGTLLSTRCAGPLDGDLAGAGPQIKLPLRELLAGRRRLDLSGTSSFAAGGFSGTITSSLSLSLGKPLRQLARGARPTRVRELDETLRLTRAEGGWKLGLSGEPNACRFLDSCAITGSLSAGLSPKDAVGSLVVLGPASRPRRDFLAALGLTRHGNPHGLEVIGEIAWGQGGTVSSNLSQPAPCASQGPLGAGAIILQPRAGRLAATYATASPLRTRCPGPVFSDGQTLATGSISLRQAGRRSFTLRMRGGRDLTDDGYAVKQDASLALTLRRGQLRETFRLG